jgi:TonB family protein
MIYFFFQFGSILYKIRQSQPAKQIGLHVRILQGLNAPFSFFRYIIIDPNQHNEQELQEILCHESTHVREGHTLDVILSELCCIVCWMNPFAWFLKKEIRMNLEFLADQAVITSKINAEHYQLHLLRLSYHKAIAQLSNNFNVSPLKKRIQMMNKKNTSRSGIIKYLLFMPLLVAGLLFFNNLQADEKQQSVVTELLSFNDLQSQHEQQSTSTEAVDALLSSNNLQTQDKKQLTNPKDKSVYAHVEKMPEFPGGNKALMKYLMDNMKYPAEAANRGIQGMVLCRFIVDEEGNISNVQVLRSVDPSLDNEALRLINAMPKWIPGQKDGKNEIVYFNLPLRFKLNGNDQETVTKTATTVAPKINDDVIIELDGKQIAKVEMKKIDVSQIESVSVNKDTSPAKILITTKK